MKRHVPDFLRKQRRKFSYVLLTACFGIWSYVLYQVRYGFSLKDDTPFAAAVTVDAAPKARSSPVQDQDAARYDAAFRDPFALPSELFVIAPATSDEQRTRVAQQQAGPPAPPPLTLNGVVGNTAMLQDQKGTIHIAHIGEQTGGAQLLKVRRDYVVVRFQGRSHTLRLIR